MEDVLVDEVLGACLDTLRLNAGDGLKNTLTRQVRVSAKSRPEVSPTCPWPRCCPHAHPSQARPEAGTRIRFLVRGQRINEAVWYHGSHVWS